MRTLHRLAVIGAVLLASAPLAAQNPDQDLTTELVASGLFFPLAIVHGSGDPDRLFIAGQDGRIYVVDQGVLQGTPFLDIRARVGAFGSSGLLGIAFHPDYANNGFFYLNYTDLAGDTVIARYQRSAMPNLADPNSEFVLLQIAQPASIHNGGGMAFGPDGYLYLSMGDGGLQGDPLGYAQNLGELLGKILRIDVDQQVGGLNYAIPPGNPFIGVPGAREEIWAYGLRNPYRMSIDQVTGDLWHGDVGERAWEEVNFQAGSSAGGENYGWNVTEGTDCYAPPSGCNTAGIQFALFQYEHVYVGPTTRCAVIGGLVYRGREMATLQGSYFFGDQCSNEVISLRQSGGAMNSIKVHFKLPDVSGQPCSNVAWGEDAAGEIYAACHQTGRIYRIIPDGMRLRVPELVATVPDLIQVVGCTPNGQVYLAYSPTGLGKKPVGALGVTLDLDGPRLGATAVANGNGVASYPVTVPSSFAGRRIWLQAAEQGAKSNVVEEVIE